MAVEHVASREHGPTVLTCAEARRARRVLVCGSRTWLSPALIRDRLVRLPARTVIVHGRCPKGADLMADYIGRSMGFEIEQHPADWAKHGKRAGFIRNVEMLETGIGLVLAFQRNDSRGTQHTIDEARRRGIPVEVFTA